MTEMVNIIGKVLVFLLLIISVLLASIQRWDPATYALALTIVLMLFDERSSS